MALFKDLKVVWENATDVCVEATQGAVRHSIMVSKILEHDGKSGSVRLRDDLLDDKRRMAALAKAMEDYISTGKVASTPPESAVRAETKS